MQPTLEPIARIPLQVTREGSVFSPTVDFGPGVVGVGQPVDRDSSAGQAVWYAPDVALVLVLLVPLLLARRVYRVVTRPQRPGVAHCRRCNYELSRPGPAACPECAGPVHRPVLGRTGVERLVGPVLLSMLVLTACVGAFALLLEKPAWMGSRTWPAPIVADLFPSLAYQKVYRPMNNDTLVTRWRLPEGSGAPARLSPAVRVRGDAINGVRMSPDARFVVACVSTYGVMGNSGGVQVTDTRDGSLKSLSLARPGVSTTPTVRGFSRDGSCVLIQVQSWDFQAPAIWCDCTLMSLDLATMVRSDIATVRCPTLMNSGSPQVPPQFFAVAEPAAAGSPCAWALFSQTQAPAVAGAQQAGEVVVPEGDGVRRIPVTCSGRAFFEPRLSGDGGTLEVDLAGTVSPATLAVDLRAGTFREFACATVPGVRGRARGLAAAWPVAGGAGGALVREETGACVARLAGTSGAATVELSADGRYAWAMEVTGPPSTGLWRCSPFNHTKGFLVIWGVPPSLIP